MLTGGSLGCNARLGRLDGYGGFNRGSLTIQAKSLRALVDPRVCGDWQWVLPGTAGRGLRFDSPEDMRHLVGRLGDRFKATQRTLKWICTGCGRSF